MNTELFVDQSVSSQTHDLTLQGIHDLDLNPCKVLCNSNELYTQ